MTQIEKLKLKLETQLEIYRESPQCTATYIDLARMIDVFFDIIESKQSIDGFNNKK